jgi:hypothetical protein
MKHKIKFFPGVFISSSSHGITTISQIKRPIVIPVTIRVPIERQRGEHLSPQHLKHKGAHSIFNI